MVDFRTPKSARVFLLYLPLHPLLGQDHHPKQKVERKEWIRIYSAYSLPVPCSCPKGPFGVGLEGSFKRRDISLHPPLGWLRFPSERHLARRC